MGKSFVEDPDMSVLFAAPLSEKKALCSRIHQFGVTVLSDRTGMIMMSALDCFDTPFHVGEALAREVKISLSGTAGWGIALGDVYENAFLSASIDAAERSGNQNLIAVIDQWVDVNRRHWKTRKEDEKRMSATTKVHFGSMAEE